MPTISLAWSRRSIYSSTTQTFGRLIGAITSSCRDTISLGGLVPDLLYSGPLSGDSKADSLVLQLSCGAIVKPGQVTALPNL